MKAVDISIHDITELDVIRVVEIENISFTHRWSLNSVISELSNPASICKKACLRDSGVTAGYIFVRVMVDEAHILKLAVHPGHRRRYVASQLVRHITWDVLKAFKGKVILEVRSSNTAAIRLYDCLGFKSLYTRRRYYDKPVEDAVVMAIDLKNHG